MPTILESDPPLSAPPPNPIFPAQPEPELELSTSPVPIEVTLAARRAKRQAILAKYTGVASVNTTEASPSPGPSSAVQPPPPSAIVSDPQSQRHSIVGENGVKSISRDPSACPSRESPHISFPEDTLKFNTLDRRESQSASPPPDIFELAKGGEEEGAQAEAQEQANRDGVREQVSAADYDPSQDRREDEQRRVRGAKEELNEDVEVIEEEEDEDEDDVDDMFAVSVADKKKKIKKVKKVIVCPVFGSFLQYDYTDFYGSPRNPLYRHSLRQLWMLPQTLKAIIKLSLASTSTVATTRSFPPLEKACLPMLCALGYSKVKQAKLARKLRSR